MSMELAAETVAILAPFLTEAGKEAAKEIGKDTVAAGGKLLGWLRAHLPGYAKAALDELEAEPGSTLNQDDLRAQIAELLVKQPDLVPELRALLPGARADTHAMSQTVTGDSVGVQNEGSQNIFTIHKG